jgi:hypothetical protein
MTRPRTAKLVARLLLATPFAMAGSLAATRVQGAAIECTGPEIEADAAVRARWPQALTTLRAHVASLSDVDACARVDLIAAGAEVVVVVTLKDGRSTSRRVTSEEELPEVIEALIVLPPADKPEDGSTATPSAAASATPPVPQNPAPGASPKAERGAVELGVGGAGHALGKPFFLGIGLTAFAQMNLGRWLLGVNARIDAIDLPVGGTEVPDDFQMRTYGIGVAAGRRAHFGAIDFDLLAGLGLYRQWQSAHISHGNSVHATYTDGRIMLVARLSEAGPARVRAFLSADVEAWLPNPSESPPPPLPDWPYWSLGVAFGVTWEGS